MKQKDIVIVSVVVFIACIVSFVASKSFIVKPAARNQQVEVVDAISTTFAPPSKAYFNDESIDPTETIQIGDTTNLAPFSDGSN